MGGKKKSKKGKKGKKEKGEKVEKVTVINPIFNCKLPHFGWIRVTLCLCDPPVPKFNVFKVIMRSNHGVAEIKKHIVNMHGRVEDVCLYSRDPYPPRAPWPNDKKELKPRIPPFRELKDLVELKKEKQAIDDKAAAKAKKAEEAAKQASSGGGGGMYIPPAEEEKKGSEMDVDPSKFKEIERYDFPTWDMGKKEDGEEEYVICYNEEDITLSEITGHYGTKWKPNLDPDKDPKPPAPVEEPPEEEQPESPDPKEGDEEGEGEGEDDAEEPVAVADDDEEGLIPKEEPEPFVPAVDITIWYDFDTYNGKDPILLASFA